MRHERHGRLLGAAAAICLSLALSGCSYNKFTSGEENIKGKWSQVENELQRRHDLIPNLVETTKGPPGRKEVPTGGGRKSR